MGSVSERCLYRIVAVTLLGLLLAVGICVSPGSAHDSGDHRMSRDLCLAAVVTPLGAGPALGGLIPRYRYLLAEATGRVASVTPRLLDPPPRVLPGTLVA